MSPKISPPPILPLGGDTPFYLISRRNRSFLFDGKKLVAATCGVYVFIHKLLHTHSEKYSVYTIINVHVRIVPPYSTFVVITTYSQRGIYKIYSKNTKYKYFLWLWAYQLYKHIYASVAGRHTLWRKEQRCPPAHFCVRRICIITNNVVYIQYRTKKYHT